MIRYYFTTVALLLSAQLFAQSLSYTYNAPRPGDEIIKQQVTYKDPGRSGTNVIWNFAELSTLHDWYKLSYHHPLTLKDTQERDSLYILGCDTFPAREHLIDSLLVGIEHNTMYYYRLHPDRLEKIGHENPTCLLRHKKPLLTYKYPMRFFDKAAEPYLSEGIYTGVDTLRSMGNIVVENDAAGILILPSGDTLRHVFRIKTTRTVYSPVNVYSETDLTFLKDTLKMEIENYQWFSAGYRYPVFETVRSFSLDGPQREETFSTAFFYPPQEHYYLDEDPDNLAMLESLLPPENNNGGNKSEDDQSLPVSYSYNIFPNPVKEYLTVEYLLHEDADIIISVYEMSGRILNHVFSGKRTKGFYCETLDFTVLTAGNYLVKMQIDGESFTEIITKIH